jgi:uncharacterized protein YjaZ
MMKFSHITALLFTVSLVLFSGCQSNPLDVDVSEVTVKVDILRFEVDLFENKLNTLEAFKAKYGAFVNDYTMGIMGFPGNENEAFAQLMLYKTDPNAKKLYQLVKEKYANFSVYEKELTQAYQYFKYYYPKDSIPVVITYISNFSLYMNPIGDGYIGISLDMHMGQDFPPYQYTNIENYWKKILIPQTISVHHITAHANDKFIGYNRGKHFLDELVYQGKLLYFLDATLRQVPDPIKIGLTQEEFDWCVKEQSNIWSFFVKEQILYETDSRKFDRFFKEGPFTIASGVPEKSPPMLGRYIGWQLVKQYMSKNPEVTLQDLMSTTKSEIILQKSRFKP